MHVVIFEGSRWPTFAPASLSRPVFCLASGMSTLLEKQVRYLEPTRLTLWVRPGLANFCRKHVTRELHRFRRPSPLGGAADADQPGVGERLVPCVDRIGQSALLAQLLEQP